MTTFPQFHAPGTVPASAATARVFDGVIFDMDGVVTDTAAVHSAAWKCMFDEFLARHAARTDTAFHEFTRDLDYRTYVDGKPRYHGVAAFLASRGILLPAGTAEDTPEAETVCGLGNRKNQLFNAIVADSGVRVYASTLALIHALQAGGIRIGLATSSRNAALLLARTQTATLFETVVDGVVSEVRHLRGKPHPEIFLTAAANLGVSPARAVVVEDAVVGVQAGAAGNFALVIGVAREGNAAELRENGADWVVRDLADVSVAAIEQAVRRKGAAS